MVSLLLPAYSAQKKSTIKLPAQQPTPDNSKAPDTTKPIKVFVLAGQSNMLEMGALLGRSSGNHRVFYQNAKPTDGEKPKHVNVAIYKGAYSPEGDFLQIPTKPGGKGIGVELAFGNMMGHVFDEPVLLIRSACGNRGLWSGFRPPSRGGWEKDENGKYGWTGTEYRYMTEGVSETLKNIADIFPGYKGQGYDIAGFVWFQGHKDTGNKETAEEYEENLVALIKDVRKDLNKPKLPVMIATVGFDGHQMSGNTLIVHQAQMAVGDPKKHPEFAGTVKTVDTRDFWRPVDKSPANQGYHYNRNAETYMLVGDALGRGMVKLLTKPKK